jgi:hypothetical protein
LLDVNVLEALNVLEGLEHVESDYVESDYVESDYVESDYVER